MSGGRVYFRPQNRIPSSRPAACPLPLLPSTSDHLPRHQPGGSPGSEVTLMLKVPRVLSMGHVWQGHKLCVGIRRPVCKSHCAMEARWLDAPQCPPEPELPHLQKEGLKRGFYQNLNLHCHSEAFWEPSAPLPPQSCISGSLRN